MLSSEELLFSDEIISVCQILYKRNCLAAADGNVSLRVGENRILITPSGRPKARLYKDDMCVVTLNGEPVIGTPSSESLMHLKVYQNVPQAKAVIHAHPPSAIAWTISYPNLKKLPDECFSELILSLGEIPIVPYARPGSQAMGEVLESYLPNNKAMVLARHGALSWGESIEEALNGMERVEHISEILIKTKLLGSITNLPEDEVKALKDMRQKFGNKTL